MQQNPLFPPLLTGNWKMVTGNLVNIEETSEMFPIKEEFLASYSKQIF